MREWGLRRRLRRTARAVRVALPVLAGLAATIAALAIAVAVPSPASSDAGPDGLVWLVALGALAVAAWLAYDVVRSRDSADAVPWSGAGPIVDEDPESTPTDEPLSGGGLVTALAQASEIARHDRDLEAGVDVVRPRLREAYADAAVRGGVDRAVVEERIETGAWTDDGVAAATLAAGIDPPRRSWRRRLGDWLFPARAVQRRTRRAVAAIAAAADEVLPPVVGSDAPRTVPVHAPDLGAIPRGPDGRLQPPGGASAGASAGPPGTDESHRRADEQSSPPGASDGRGGRDEP